MKFQLWIFGLITFTSVHGMQQGYLLIPQPIRLSNCMIDLNDVDVYFKLATEKANRTQEPSLSLPSPLMGYTVVHKAVCMLRSQVARVSVIRLGEEWPRFICHRTFCRELCGIYERNYRNFHAYKQNHETTFDYFSPVADNIAIAMYQYGDLQLLPTAQ